MAKQTESRKNGFWHRWNIGHQPKLEKGVFDLLLILDPVRCLDGPWFAIVIGLKKN